MKIQVWKVVLYSLSGQRVSAAAMGKHEVVYPIRVPLQHKNLFVFDKPLTKGDLNQHWGILDEVWLAETDAVKEAPAIVPSTAHLDEIFDEFWKDPRRWTTLHGGFAVPPNTVLCDSLTLIKRIFPE
jgi:hypothetical protein